MEDLIIKMKWLVQIKSRSYLESELVVQIIKIFGTAFVSCNREIDFGIQSKSFLEKVSYSGMHSEVFQA